MNTGEIKWQKNLIIFCSGSPIVQHWSFNNIKRKTVKK